MAEKKGFIAIIIFLLLLLALKPSLIGTTTSSITPTEWFGEWWLGIGNTLQTAIIFTILVVLVSLVIGTHKK